MPVVAFASLVVVPYDAAARITVKQAVLEAVQTAGDRLGNIPDGHFDDGAVGEFRTVVEHTLCLHMAYCAMIFVWRQETYVRLTEVVCRPASADFYGFAAKRHGSDEGLMSSSEPL